METITYSTAGIYRPFRTKTLEDFQVTEHNREALKATEEFIAKLPNIRDERGLLLTGPAGRGKTFLAMMVAKAAVEAIVPTICMPTWKYLRVFFRIKEYGDFVRRTDDMETARKWETALKMELELCQGYRLLILDDMGLEHSESGWVRGKIEELLRERWSNGLPTVATSNVPPENWATEYSESMYSLIHEVFTPVSITGADWRRAE